MYYKLVYIIVGRPVTEVSALPKTHNILWDLSWRDRSRSPYIFFSMWEWGEIPHFPLKMPSNSSFFSRAHRPNEKNMAKLI